MFLWEDIYLTICSYHIRAVATAAPCPSVSCESHSVVSKQATEQTSDNSAAGEMLRCETVVFTVKRYANVGFGDHSSSEAAVLIISSTFNIVPPNMYEEKLGVHALIFKNSLFFWHQISMSISRSPSLVMLNRSGINGGQGRPGTYVHVTDHLQQWTTHVWDFIIVKLKG